MNNGDYMNYDDVTTLAYERRLLSFGFSFLAMLSGDGAAVDGWISAGARCGVKEGAATLRGFLPKEGRVAGN